MKQRKKKKGSVLLVVIGMFAFISIIVVSLMSMTTTGFKLKKTENTRIENFYGADSGIEIADSITIELINQAITLANNKVKEESDKNPKLTNDEKNKIFQKKYIEYIQQNYKQEIEKEEKYKISIDESKNEEIKILASIYPTEYTESIKELDSTVNSTFIDKDNKQREVEVSQKIKVPEYSTSQNTISKPGANLLQYVMGVDGNLYINNTNNDLDIYGDIWVAGNSQQEEKGIYLKSEYTGTEKYNIDFKGRVLTRENFSISGSKVKFDENIYASNLILTGKNDIKASKDIKLYNDFIFNSDNTYIKMRNLYGLNDINVFENNDSSSASIPLNERERSSSVIINSKDFGKETGKYPIEADNMYIAGTAYIGGLNETDSLKNYQSGESIVINRNTLPYTARVLDEEKYLYKYKNPLHIVDKIYKENGYENIKLKEKIALVEEYYASKNIKEVQEANGIKINNQIYSTGVSYANGIVNKHSDDVSSKIRSHQLDFAKEVFLMGAEQADMDVFWNKQTVNSIESSIGWDKIQQVINKGTIYKNENPYEGSNKEVLFEKAKNNGNSFSQSDYEKIGFFISNKSIEQHIDWIFKSEFDGLSEHDKQIKRLEIINKLNDIRHNKVNLIFNLTDKDIVINQQKHGSYDGKIYIKTNENTESNIIISKGTVVIETKNGNSQGTSKNLYDVAFTCKDLVYDLNSATIIGSFSTNTNILQYFYENLFKLNVFEGIFNLNNGSGGNQGSSTSSESIINSNEVFKDRKWKLIR